MPMGSGCSLVDLGRFFSVQLGWLQRRRSSVIRLSSWILLSGFDTILLLRWRSVDMMPIFCLT